jgi:DNA modification methylase
MKYDLKLKNNINNKMDYKKDLATKLEDLKKIEGFPIGKDEDVIALSQPPFYTACPNPYIDDFIKEHGQLYDEYNDTYRKTPFTDDIDTNKNDKLTNAHSYHTKSPFHAIQQYIEHYSNEGDIVLDCFTGSGMTGIAAQKSKRKAILLDLSPIASYLAYNYKHR